MPPLSVRKKSSAPAFIPDAPLLAELKAQRRAQQDASRRIEELKMRLFQMADRNMDQTVNLIRYWVKEKAKA